MEPSSKVNKNYALNVRGRLLDLSTPKVMGILNITPDSFYDGGKFRHIDKILSRVDQMICENVDIIDVGGASSRPAASLVSIEEEKGRVCPVIDQVKKHFPNTVISVDTYSAEVASSALNVGADIVNDITGGQDNQMFQLVAKNKIPYILMHMRGDSRNMHGLTQYEDIVKEICFYFATRIAKLRELGVIDVVIDPGFGFAKTLEQNYFILKHLNVFKLLDVPILAGISRKSMLYKLLESTPEKALNATTAAHIFCLKGGANILRVHDVKEAVETIRIYQYTHDITL